MNYKNRHKKQSYHFSAQFNTTLKEYGERDLSGPKTEYNFLSIHEAFTTIKLNRYLNTSIGRQEKISQNDRLFGSAEWTNSNRSYDQLGLIYQRRFQGVGGHLIKINQDTRFNINDIKNNQDVLHFFYFDSFESIDLVEINSFINKNSIAKFQTHHLSLNHQLSRLKMDFDYIIQNQIFSDYSDNESLYELSMGTALTEDERVFSAIGYGVASKNFNPLFGSGLKFQGHHTNLFGGKNITDTSFHINYKWNDNVFIGGDYHSYQKTKKEGAIINQLNTKSINLKTDEINIGQEWGIILLFSKSNSHSHNLSISSFFPGLAFEEEDRNINTTLKYEFTHLINL